MSKYDSNLDAYLDELKQRGYTVRMNNSVAYPKIAIEVETDGATVIRWVDHYDIPNERAVINEIQKIVDEIEGVVRWSEMK